MHDDLRGVWGRLTACLHVLQTYASFLTHNTGRAALQKDPCDTGTSRFPFFYE